MPWPQTGATQYHAQLGLPDKGYAIKELVVCNSWDLEAWGLLNGLALGCYQPSPEVWIVKLIICIVFCSNNYNTFNPVAATHFFSYQEGIRLNLKVKIAFAIAFIFYSQRWILKKLFVTVTRPTRLWSPQIRWKIKCQLVHKQSFLIIFLKLPRFLN